MRAVRAVPAAAAALLAACSAGAPHPAAAPSVPPAPSAPTATPTPSEPPAAAPVTKRPTPRATGPSVIGYVDARRGDVDGDGRADVVDLVESTTEAHDDTWRFGVRVRFAAGGATTHWFGYGYGSMDGQQLAPVADVTGDGRGDAVVSPGTSASGSAWEVLTLRGGRLAPLRGADLWHGVFGSWGCAGRGRLYAGTAVHGDDDVLRGRVTYYRLDGARLRAESSRPVGSWRLGADPPAAFDPDPGCGALG